MYLHRNARDDGNTMTINDIYVWIFDGEQDYYCACQGEVMLIYGCTNLDACNYNPQANQDDQSCIYIGMPA